MIRHNSGFWLHDGEHARQDVDVWREVYKDDGYLTRLMPPAKKVIDVGAHIGTFARKWHEKLPAAKIACIEACPENLDVLTANVGDFATVIAAACTYETGELKLINSILAGGEATGGSIVATRETVLAQELIDKRSYWDDLRPLRKVTIEDVMQQMGFHTLDLLKLDCEGSEYSILEHCTCLDRIAFICGEYHDCERWDRFVAEKFSSWEYRALHRSGNQGTFHLRNRNAIRSTVLTNGCFDMLGPHHVEFLRRCRPLADRLVVAINSDTSVRALKGSDRPVYNQQEREMMLRSLRVVDDVHVFDTEEELLALIKKLRPEVLAKGADYTGRPITGAELVPRVELIPLVEGRGTTLTLRRIRA